jgi:murein DD-endopeptidase MepM/ murein hydrolase activator NlpD
MGNPFIKRRERPLTMRLAVAALLFSILASGLFSLTPLGASASSEGSAFETLSSAVVVHGNPGYQIYVAKQGDDLQSIAERFGVQIGGIIEMNNLPIGQELQAGNSYKIPDDPYYGANYRPTFPYVPSGNDMSRLATYDWWTAYAGSKVLPGQPCAPDGGTNPLGYDLRSPLWNSGWVRGFSWYHNGVDISNGFGQPIRAAQYGEVLWSGWTNTGFGYSVVIDHCHHLETLYGHMSRLLIKEGDTVSPGQIIGLEGATGWATGPHLHLSVLYYGQFVDPMAYYPSVYALTHGP